VQAVQQLAVVDHHLEHTKATQILRLLGKPQCQRMILSPRLRILHGGHEKLMLAPCLLEEVESVKVMVPKVGLIA